MEPTDHLEQTEPSIHKTEQESCETECSVLAPESEITTKQNPMDDSKAGEPVYTSQWLRENTRIHGWLKFILYWYFPLGLLSAIFHALIEVLSGSRGLPLVSSLFGYCTSIILLFIPICLFRLRKPNAVFYAFLYLLYDCLQITVAIALGLLPLLASIPSFAINIALLFYFELSKQVRNVIPLSFRKTSKLDRIVYRVLLTFFAICSLVFLYGITIPVDLFTFVTGLLFSFFLFGFLLLSLYPPKNEKK